MWVVLVALVGITVGLCLPSECATCQIDGTASGGSLWTVCPSQAVTSATFAADPEVRTYDGRELVTFTAVATAQLPHLYIASRSSAGACWDGVAQVTLDEFQNSTYQCVNEVSTFFVNGSDIWVYYVRHCRPLFGDFDTETMSLRAKRGAYNPTGLPAASFTSEAFGVNTFALWANSKSPDLPFVTHAPAALAGCYPPIEPSVIFDGLQLTMAFGCVDLTRLPAIVWSVRVLVSADPLFAAFSGPYEILSSSAWCNDSMAEFGLQAPSFLRFGDEVLLSASPIGQSSGDYGGCVIFPVTNLTAPITGPARYALQPGVIHIGSCSGGDGSIRTQDRAATRDILYFSAANHSAFYTIQQSTLPSIVAPTSSSTTNGGTGSSSSSAAAASMLPLGLVAVVF
jgi:hypothetical protein